MTQKIKPMTVDEAWRDLVEMTDRTSPSEYPDMALITREELASYMHGATAENWWRQKSIADHQAFRAMRSFINEVVPMQSEEADLLNGPEFQVSCEVVAKAVVEFVRDLRAERDEADRRAGAAERRSADLQDRVNKRDSWLRDAKEKRGYHNNVPFDRVWAETCAKADSSDAAPYKEALRQLVSLRTEAEMINGGGPGWAERSRKAWMEAEDLVRVEP